MYGMIMELNVDNSWFARKEEKSKELAKWGGESSRGEEGEWGEIR